MTPDEVLTSARFTLGYWSVVCVAATFATAAIARYIYSTAQDDNEVGLSLGVGFVSFILANIALVLIFYFARSNVVPASVDGYVKAVEKLKAEGGNE